MDVAQLVPAIVAIASLVVIGLAGAGFGPDSRDPEIRR